MSDLFPSFPSLMLNRFLLLMVNSLFNMNLSEKKQIIIEQQRICLSLHY